MDASPLGSSSKLERTYNDSVNSILLNSELSSYCCYSFCCYNFLENYSNRIYWIYKLLEVFYNYSYSYFCCYYLSYNSFLHYSIIIYWIYKILELFYNIDKFSSFITIFINNF